MGNKKDDMAVIEAWIRSGELAQEKPNGYHSNGYKSNRNILPAGQPHSEIPSLAPVAITGLSGFFPGCMDVASFWENIDRDQRMITEIPRSRFDWRDYYQTSGAEKKAMCTKLGGFIPDIASFDPRLFGMLPLEAKELDPRQRLLLMSTWRTLEDAGLEPLSLKKSRTGVFIGCEVNEYAQLMRQKGIAGIGLFNQADSMISNRISYFFDFAGPSEFINSMCSSFAVALHRAVAALRMGEIDRAIVGGANIMLSPDLFVALSNGQQLSSQETVKSFGKGGDGYIRAEGVGTILIERMSAVQAAGRYAYATIRHTAINFNGQGGMSIAAPNVGAHSELIQRCYREAGINPRHLDYIEAQGMGLPVADIAEWAALNQALKALHKEQGLAVLPGSCRVSTLKPMTGHMHAASSLGALLKVIRSFQTQKIHKILDFDQPNEYCDMDDAPCRIVTETEDWAEKSYPRLAALHSYGSGGNNAHVLLEEVRAIDNGPKKSWEPRPFQLIPCWFEALESGTSVKSPENPATTDAGYPLPVPKTEKKAASLRAILAILGFEEGDIDLETPFSTLGLDSASVGLFTARLNAEFHLAIRQSDIFNFSSPAKLADYLTSLLGRQSIAGSHEQSNGVVPSKKQAGISGSLPKPDISENDIAIIGMSLQVAGANHYADFWEMLRRGQSAIGPLPPHRIPPADEHLPLIKGGFLNEIDKFDPLFFNISPKEAEYMDPRHRLLLEHAYAAIENSGYSPADWKGAQNGIFIGLEESDYTFTAHSTITSIHGGTAPARIGYFLDTKGPLLALSTACSSSLVAIHYACKSILQGESRYALAGGCNVISNPARTLTALSRMGNMLSPDSTCYAFDERANGMVVGEGVGIVVLKQLSQAIHDNDTIHGIIKGSDINYDGKTNGLTAPNGLRQRELYERVCEKSGVSLDQISLMLAHGTGTALGDPIECNGLIDAHAAVSKQKQYCALTSVKTNIGHTLAASGVISLIAATLALQHKQIPASLNFRVNNKDVQFEGSPFYVNTALKVWNQQVYFAAVNAFGHTGTNAHLILAAHDEAPSREFRLPRHPESQIIVLSAKNRERLNRVAANLLGFLQKNGEGVKLQDLAFTLLLGREAMEQRLGFTAESISDVIKKLRYFLDGHAVGAEIYISPANPRSKRGHAELQAPPAQEIVDAWIEQARLSTLLEFWVEGNPVNWQPLFAGKAPKRIPLPGYPFLRESYWLPDDGVPVLGMNPAPGRTDAGDHEVARGFLQPGHGTLKEKSEAYFKALIAGFLKIAVERIDVDTPLEKYGLDSIDIGELTTQLRKAIPEIDSTLFFEFPTIDLITEHLIAQRQESLERLVGAHPHNTTEKAAEKYPSPDPADERGIRCIKPAANASARVLAFHPFGFGAKSLAWMNQLSDEIEVWGVGATHISDWKDLTDLLTEKVKDLFDKPVVVWGHSMGGIIAFEVLHQLEKTYGLTARSFLVSSAAAPVVFEQIKHNSPFYEIEVSLDAEQIEEILLNNHYIVPKQSGLPVISSQALLNDALLCKRYAFDRQKKISTPLYMVQASNDILIKDDSFIMQWESRSTGGCRYETIEGTHLFFIRPPRGFVNILLKCCRETGPSSQHIAPGVYCLKEVYSGTAEVHLFPLSTSPQGYIMYTACGHMAAHLWHPKRIHLNEKAALSHEAFMTYTAYSGEYRVENGISHHDVFVSMLPDQENRRLDRYIDRDQGDLTLLTSPMVMESEGQYSAAPFQKVVWVPSRHSPNPIDVHFTGCWKLKKISGLSGDIGKKAFKGQCLVDSGGYISVLINHRHRKRLFYKNYALASADEITACLQSCILWFARIVHANGTQFECETLVSQTCEPILMGQFTAVFEDETLLLSWSLPRQGAQKIVTEWEKVPNISTDNHYG